LKILFSNICIYDCAYCINRAGNDIRRVAFSVNELCDLTEQFYRRNYIEGLFLSSGIMGSPDFTMKRMIAVARTLRRDRGFGGYIHLKSIPGASRRLIWEAGLYANRLSVNIELPTEVSLNRLAPEKRKPDILGSMGFIGSGISETREDMRRIRHTPSFAPAGQSTQLIVGASPEDDGQILRLASSLYRAYHLRRVYYSAFVPVQPDRRLPVCGQPPLRREHRLYQADWLMRFYGFQADEILPPDRSYLELDLEPKSAWALRNLHLFPVEINRAKYDMLLRVPGIGRLSAGRIVKARKFGSLDFDTLSRIGVVMKRARYFITCSGRTLDRISLDPVQLRRLLLGDGGRRNNGGGKGTCTQLDLFQPLEGEL
jgi:putative DNA modification/repair radical SAM protein